MNRFAAAFLTMAALTTPAFAGVQTEIIDFFPEGEHSVASMLRFVRPELTGRTIVETRLFLSFTPSPGYDAGDFYLLLVAPVSPAERGDGFIFVDTRADLGWSGQGTFTAQLTFPNLNGVLESGLWTFDVFPTIDPPIYSGTFSDDTRWEVDTIPSPGVCVLAIAGCLGVARRRRWSLRAGA